MELNKIEKLIEAYFEGKTTIEQEQRLRSYFSRDQVASHLEPYKSMFVAFLQAKQEVSTRDFKVTGVTQTRNRWYGIAATIAVLAVLAGFMFSNSRITQEEKEALAAYKQTKEALQLLSQKFNQGTETLVAINEFTVAKNKVLK